MDLEWKFDSRRPFLKSLNENIESRTIATAGHRSPTFDIFFPVSHEAPSTESSLI